MLETWRVVSQSVPLFTHLPPALVSLAASGFRTLGVTQVFFMARHQLLVFTTPALLLHLLADRWRDSVCVSQRFRVWLRICVFVCVWPVCRSRSSLCDTSLNRCVFHTTEGGRTCRRMAALPPCTAETTLKHTHTHTEWHLENTSTEWQTCVLCVCVCYFLN